MEAIASLALPYESPPVRRRQWPRAAFSLWVLLTSPLSAQPIDRFERLDSHRGLAHNSIGALLEDRQGFLWIGTFDGLSRYDGVEFITWRHDADNPRSLPSNSVYALLEDRRGHLWVGTSRGLGYMKRSGWDAYRFDGLSIPATTGRPTSVAVWALLEDRNGAVWAGLANGLLRHSPDGSVDIFRHDPTDPRSLPAEAVYDLAEDPAGDVWVLSSPSLELRHRLATLSRYDAKAGDFEHVTMPEPWDVSGFLIDPAGTFWLNVPGLATFDPEQSVFDYPYLEESSPPLGDLASDMDGDLWITTVRGFLRYQPTTRVLSENLPSQASEDRLARFATVFLEGSDGTQWLGTRGGLFQGNPHRKRFFHRRRRVGDAGSLTSDRISAVLVDNQGATWVGTYGAGLNHLASLHGPVRRYRHQADDPRSLCHDTIWHLAEATDGDLWIGVDDGLCLYQRATKHFRRFPLGSSSAETAGRSVRYIAIAPNGRLWLGTDVGLQSVDPGRGLVSAHSADDLNFRLVHSLYFDQHETLWVGTGNGLKTFDPNDETWSDHPLVTPEGLNLVSEGIYDIRLGKGDTLWLASGDGLSHFHPRKGLVEHYDAGDGLPGSSVFSLLEAEDGRFWLGTNLGLSRFDPGAPRGAQFRNYVPSDGIGNLEFNRHAADFTADGTFVVGGMDGLTIFRPDEIRDNPVAPRLALTEVRVDSRQGERLFIPGFDSTLVLDHDEASFSVALAGLSFTHAHRNRYRLRLEGLDDRWIDNDNHRFARYHRLEPGQYRLQARASNSDGIWSADEDLLTIRVRPAFWQTVWFRGLVLALILAALHGLHRMRVSRLLEIERLRLRIADDLHDDLSSELSGIALTMEVLQRQGIDSAHKDRVAQVRDRALVMLDRLRDIVWCIDPDHDTQEALVRKLRVTADTLLVSHTYRFVTDLDGGAIPLGVRRGLLLVFKETLHNVLRHAQATCIDIRLIQSGGDLTLRVLDDGLGLDRANSRLGGGLTSMQRRAAAMAGRLYVFPRKSGGTEVRLEVPAYPHDEHPSLSSEIRMASGEPTAEAQKLHKNWQLNLRRNRWLSRRRARR